MREPVTDKQTHAAELAKIQQIWTMLDNPHDALYGFAALEEFFRMHPEYLSLQENASFTSKFKRASVARLIWPSRMKDRPTDTFVNTAPVMPRVRLPAAYGCSSIPACQQPQRIDSTSGKWNRLCYVSRCPMPTRHEGRRGAATFQRGRIQRTNPGGRG